MGFKSWMMKNAPGAPGSICSNFGKVFEVKKNKYPHAANNNLFYEIMRSRHPLAPEWLIRELINKAGNDFLLFIFIIVVYQNKGHLLTVAENIHETTQAIYDVALKNFPLYITCSYDDFTRNSMITLMNIEPFINQ
jgi:hypothetical protein